MYIGFVLIVTALGSKRKIGGGLAFLWSVLLSPIIALAIVLFSDKKETEKQIVYVNSNEKPKEKSKDELRTELLMQLEKLSSLKEKGIVNDDVFEKEKAKILLQLGHAVNFVNGNDAVNSNTSDKKGNYGNLNEKLGAKINEDKILSLNTNKPVEKYEHKSSSNNSVGIMIMLGVLFAVCGFCIWYYYSNNTQKVDEKIITNDISNEENRVEQNENSKNTIDVVDEDVVMQIDTAEFASKFWKAAFGSIVESFAHTINELENHEKAEGRDYERFGNVLTTYGIDNSTKYEGLEPDGVIGVCTFTFDFKLQGKTRKMFFSELKKAKEGKYKLAFDQINIEIIEDSDRHFIFKASEIFVGD